MEQSTMNKKFVKIMLALFLTDAAVIALGYGADALFKAGEGFFGVLAIVGIAAAVFVGGRYVVRLHNSDKASLK